MSIKNTQINWADVKRILVIRLRSIGDTVLATPSLIALRRFLPEAQIDILLEDWVAPVLTDFEAIDNVISFKKDDLRARLGAARQIRQTRYDVVFNLHGGTTSTFLARASGARERVGYAHYRYKFLYNRLLSSSADFWQKAKTHSAEQQLALLGFAGVPVEDRPKSRLTVSAKRAEEMQEFLSLQGFGEKKLALIHPVAAFDTKQWSAQNFARTIEFLRTKDLEPVMVATPTEKQAVEEIGRHTETSFQSFTHFSLPEITALAARSAVFVGNDSGIAHIAAAVETPCVVIFGSSNRDHWRPWTNAPHEIVYESFPCQPCAGYVCKQFDAPQCILSVKPESVFSAIEKVLS